VAADLLAVDGVASRWPPACSSTAPTHTLAHLGPVWAHRTAGWATTPVAATARTDLAGAHETLATLHGRLRRTENPWIPT